MSIVPQTHHGMCVADLGSTKAVLRAIGFSGTQANAPEPLVFENREGDPVGQQTALTLGDRYATHFIEQPGRRHQIDLIEVVPPDLQARPSAAVCEGDLLIAIAVDDIGSALAAMRAAAADHGVRWSPPVEVPAEHGVRFVGPEGQALLVTEGPEPFAVVHHSPDGWARSRAFYVEALGLELEQIGAGAGVERFRFVGIGGRLEVEVRSDVVEAPRPWPNKRYPGANHFRFVGLDFAEVLPRLEACAGAGYLLPAEGGFAFVHGPANQTVELFDTLLSGPVDEPSEVSGAPAPR
jgi:hypothetical protein